MENYRREQIYRLYRWPLILLRVLQILYVVVGSLGTAIYLASQDLWAPVGVLIPISMGMWAWATVVRQKFLAAKPSGWLQTILLSSITLCSFLFPLAIASLVQLFNQNKKRVFDSLEAPPAEPQLTIEPHTWIATNNILIFCGLLLASVAVIKYLQTPAAASSFRVDLNLSVHQLYDLGRTCNTKGDTVCSRAVFKRLIEINPNDMTAIANLGMAESNAGEHKAAISVFENYFNRGGGALDVMAYYGTSLSAIGEKGEALKWYLRALQQNPRLIDVAENVVTLLIDSGKTTEATLFINKFLKENPSASKYFGGIRERILTEAARGDH